MSLLFSAGRIGSLELQNRLIHSATFEAMATDRGEVTDGLVKRYSTLAKGGIGLIIPGYIYVHPVGKAFNRQVPCDSDEAIPGLKRVVDAVHERGGKIVFQIANAGRQTTKSMTGFRPLGPSSFDRDPLYMVKPKEMTEGDIREAIEAFGQSARRVMEAGADGVQLHAAHGYLINQFLSPFFNRRTDSWGGSDESRFRFLEEVFTSAKTSVPDGTPILIKLNTNDHTPTQGVTPDVAKYYAGRLARMGIAAIEISSGTGAYSFMNMCRGRVPVDELVAALPFWKKPFARMLLNKMVGKFDLQEGYHLGAAKTVKPALRNLPLILVGGMRRAAHMEEILEQGYADFISMSRPFIREPFLAKRLKEGKAEAASCVSCNKCLASITAGEALRCRYKPA